MEKTLKRLIAISVGIMLGMIISSYYEAQERIDFDDINNAKREIRLNQKLIERMFGGR